MKFYDVAKTGSEWTGLVQLEPVMIKAKTQKELRQKCGDGFLVLDQPSPEIFRKALDKSLVDAVLPDRLHGHDYLHHKRTLLNNVTLKIMKKYNISLLFTFKELLNTKNKDRALVWGRMKYEMMLCLKKGVHVMIASGATKNNELVHVKTLLAMGELLGLRPEQAKKALNYVHEKIINR